MIDLHYWPTPNGHKITLFLEETGLPYRVIPVNIGAGEQFNPKFLAISPNNRMPAIVDHAPIDGGRPISLFESGAILLYLAQKTEQFIPEDARGSVEVLQWLFWQVGGLGPIAGQNNSKEIRRLYGVLDRRLADREYVAGAYSIADMAAYPSIVPYEAQGQNLADFPHLQRWFAAIQSRPATVRAYDRAHNFSTGQTGDSALRE